jgi:hypothetical protein
LFGTRFTCCLKITSDCQLAKAMLLRAANEAIGAYLVEAQSSWKVMSDNWQSANPSLEPTLALVVNAGSLEFTVSYVVDYTKRTALKDQLFTKIVEEVANSAGRLQWASSAVIPMSPPGDAGHESKALLPSSSTLGAGHARQIPISVSPPLGHPEDWRGGQPHAFCKERENRCREGRLRSSPNPRFRVASKRAAAVPALLVEPGIHARFSQVWHNCRNQALSSSTCRSGRNPVNECNSDFSPAT